ncbi:MAG: hypothetical protein DRP22_02945 [Verrucomicrobia bacterium]|nr:MAG: hypothetical protein DRP22_02945 [Verrucomicrobiota bacterium]
MEGKISFWAGIFLIFTAVLFFMVFLAYVWVFSVDDAYISFRYGKHLAEGHGLVWNVNESPVEGYTSFLWVLVNAIFHMLGLNPRLWTKFLGLAAVSGIAYLYWTVARIVFPRDANSRFLAFCSAVVLLLMNPATAIHTVSGMETAAYSAALLATGVGAVRACLAPGRRTFGEFSLFALTASLLRPEATAVSLVLGGTILVLLGRQRRMWARVFLISFAAGYILPLAAYHVFRVFYFHSLLPLPFYVKTLSHGTLYGGLTTLLRAGRIMTPLLIVIFLAIRVVEEAFLEAAEARGRFLRVCIVLGVTVLSADIVYPFSSLWMNYAQRFYFPSFVLIYPLAGLALSWFARWGRQVRARAGVLERSTHMLVYFLTLGAMLLPNTAFVGDLRRQRRYGERLAVAHVALGKALHRFRHWHLTVASSDAGAVPYYSGWRHIDMVGLNNRFIAKHHSATAEYLERQNPQLLVFISRDGSSPRRDDFQLPFIRFAEARHYVAMPSIKWQENYYLLCFVDPDVTGFAELEAQIRTVSRNSFRGKG